MVLTAYCSRSPCSASVPTMAYDSCDVILWGEAYYFGKKLLRMAGYTKIRTMFIHVVRASRLNTHNAHRERTSTTQSRNQIGSFHIPSTVVGSTAFWFTVDLHVVHAHRMHHVYSHSLCHIRVSHHGHSKSINISVLDNHI